LSLVDPHDLYCERLTPELWSEPVNALTNVAFLVGAVWVYRRSPLGAALLTTIGIGSFLFHTLANTWTMAADVLPIVVFVLVALHQATRRILQLSLAQIAGALTLLSLPVLPLWRWAQDPAAMGVAYLPAIFMLALVGILLRQRGHPSANRALVASGVVGIAWTLRALDAWSCAHISVGTHFLWHLLAALGLTLVAAAVLDRSVKPAELPHSPQPGAAPEG